MAHNKEWSGRGRSRTRLPRPRYGTQMSVPLEAFTGQHGRQRLAAQSSMRTNINNDRFTHNGPYTPNSTDFRHNACGVPNPPTYHDKASNSFNTTKDRETRTKSFAPTKVNRKHSNNAGKNHTQPSSSFNTDTSCHNSMKPIDRIRHQSRQQNFIERPTDRCDNVPNTSMHNKSTPDNIIVPNTHSNDTNHPPFTSSQPASTNTNYAHSRVPVNNLQESGKSTSVYPATGSSDVRKDGGDCGSKLEQARVDQNNNEKRVVLEATEEAREEFSTPIEASRAQPTDASTKGPQNNALKPNLTTANATVNSSSDMPDSGLSPRSSSTPPISVAVTGSQTMTHADSKSSSFNRRARSSSTQRSTVVGNVANSYRRNSQDILPASRTGPFFPSLMNLGQPVNRSRHNGVSEAPWHIGRDGSRGNKHGYSNHLQTHFRGMGQSMHNNFAHAVNHANPALLGFPHLPIHAVSRLPNQPTIQALWSQPPPPLPAIPHNTPVVSGDGTQRQHNLHTVSSMSSGNNASGAWGRVANHGYHTASTSSVGSVNDADWPKVGQVVSESVQIISNGSNPNSNILKSQGSSFISGNERLTRNINRNYNRYPFHTNHSQQGSYSHHSKGRPLINNSHDRNQRQPRHNPHRNQKFHIRDQSSDRSSQERSHNPIKQEVRNYRLRPGVVNEPWRSNPRNGGSQSSRNEGVREEATTNKDRHCGASNGSLPNNVKTNTQRETIIYKCDKESNEKLVASKDTLNMQLKNKDTESELKLNKEKEGSKQDGGDSNPVLAKPEYGDCDDSGDKPSLDMSEQASGLREELEAEMELAKQMALPVNVSRQDSSKSKHSSALGLNAAFLNPDAQIFSPTIEDGKGNQYTMTTERGTIHFRPVPGGCQAASDPRYIIREDSYPEGDEVNADGYSHSVDSNTAGNDSTPSVFVFPQTSNQNYSTLQQTPYQNSSQLQHITDPNILPATFSTLSQEQTGDTNFQTNLQHSNFSLAQQNLNDVNAINSSLNQNIIPVAYQTNTIGQEPVLMMNTTHQLATLQQYQSLDQHQSSQNMAQNIQGPQAQQGKYPKSSQDWIPQSMDSQQALYPSGCTPSGSYIEPPSYIVMNVTHSPAALPVTPVGHFPPQFSLPVHHIMTPQPMGIPGSKMEPEHTAPLFIPSNSSDCFRAESQEISQPFYIPQYTQPFSMQETYQSPQGGYFWITPNTLLPTNPEIANGTFNLPAVQTVPKDISSTDMPIPLTPVDAPNVQGNDSGFVSTPTIQEAMQEIVSKACMDFTLPSNTEDMASKLARRKKEREDEALEFNKMMMNLSSFKEHGKNENLDRKLSKLPEKKRLEIELLMRLINLNSENESTSEGSSPVSQFNKLTKFNRLVVSQAPPSLVKNLINGLPQIGTTQSREAKSETSLGSMILKCIDELSIDKGSQKVDVAAADKTDAGCAVDDSVTATTCDDAETTANKLEPEEETDTNKETEEETDPKTSTSGSCYECTCEDITSDSSQDEQPPQASTTEVGSHESDNYCETNQSRGHNFSSQTIQDDTSPIQPEALSTSLSQDPRIVPSHTVVPKHATPPTPTSIPAPIIAPTSQASITPLNVAFRRPGGRANLRRVVDTRSPALDKVEIGSKIGMFENLTKR